MLTIQGAGFDPYVVKADVMKEVAVKILKGLGHFKNGGDDEK
ncbi:hypothetical protein IMSAGC009_03370 [Lachnospiraceae bacterium]|nr:hypothetical protein IMSAGC009_03370 [Lachnospiraceae bacterium]